MRFMANSRMADGATPDQLTGFFSEHGFSASAWDLVRHRIVTEYAMKVGSEPGIVLFLEADSQDDVSDLVDGLPVVQQGLLTFEVDPLGKSLRL